MTLGLTKSEIAAMFAGAGDRMEQHYEALAKETAQMNELGGLFSSMMVTLSATVQDLVLANNEKIVSQLKATGVLK